MFDTEEILKIGKLLQSSMPVVFANNGHSADDNLLQMKITHYGNESSFFCRLAQVLDDYFKKQGLSVDYCEEKSKPMMYLRSSKDRDVRAGISVTMSKKMLVLFFPPS